MTEFNPHDRISTIELEADLTGGDNQQMHQDRAMAIADLVEDASFSPVKAKTAGVEGPFKLHMSRIESRLLLDIKTTSDSPAGQVLLSLTPFRRVIKEYKLIIESYYKALRENPAKIEAIDMARRGLHNEAATLLIERLDGKIDLDFDTARRLITLILALEESKAKDHGQNLSHTQSAVKPSAQKPKSQVSVLFVCTRNAIRSAMAEAMLQHQIDTVEDLSGVYADSAGLDPTEVDGFAVAVLREQGLHLERHESKYLDDLNFKNFDFIITMSKAANVRVQNMISGTSIQHVHWDVSEPEINAGNRELSLVSYRQIRDQISDRLTRGLSMLRA
ncbi:MAG: UPF0262 family protein [Alphaproteobacteria bacterium]